jgi:hypothetical protein
MLHTVSMILEFTKLRWAECVCKLVNEITGHIIQVGIPHGEKKLRNPRRKWGDYIKLIIKGTVWGMLVYRKSKNRVQCRAFFKLLLEFRRWSMRMEGQTRLHHFPLILRTSGKWRIKSRDVQGTIFDPAIWGVYSGSSHCLQTQPAAMTYLRACKFALRYWRCQARWSYRNTQSPVASYLSKLL